MDRFVARQGGGYLAFLPVCALMTEGLVVRMGTRHIGMNVLGGELAYISHAHTDHCAALGGPLPIFCSDVTADILGLKEAPAKKEEEKKIESPPPEAPPLAPDVKKSKRKRKSGAASSSSRFRGFSRFKRAAMGSLRVPLPEGVELHSAGHMLGSTQIAGASERWGRVAYTGDFKLRDGLTIKGAPMLTCDTLFAECTYGDPAVQFAHPQDVLADMERWGRQNREAIQLWGGYSTGKAQELVKFINDYLGETPVVGGRAAEVCEAYRRAGVKLEWKTPESPEGQEMMRAPFMAVMPPHQLTPILRARLETVHRRRALSAVATGWALVRHLPYSAAFPLSDHADFNEILEYAHASGAKQVILAHGDNERTAKALRAAGVNAVSIESLDVEQTTLKIEEGNGQ
ncbi:Uncharacterised protein [uncultured archaeon]|nr:Uncharacterised protein [uncultured archaeon]